MFPFSFPGSIYLHSFCFSSSGLACVGYLPPNSPLWHLPSGFCFFSFFWFISVLFSWPFHYFSVQAPRVEAVDSCVCSARSLVDILANGLGFPFRGRRQGVS